MTHDRGNAPLAVWTDEGLTVSRRAAARYEPVDDGDGPWRSLPQSPTDLDAAASVVVGANGRIVAVDPSSLDVVAFDPTCFTVVDAAGSAAAAAPAGRRRRR